MRLAGFDERVGVRMACFRWPDSALGLINV